MLTSLAVAGPVRYGQLAMQLGLNTVGGRRDSIVGLASATLVLAAASVVAGRFGVSDHAVASLGIGLVGLLAAAIALLSRSMRVPVYRSVRAGLAPFAHGALVLVAGLGAFLTWPGAMREGALISLIAALAFHAAWSAPHLARADGAVFADALTERFASRLLDGLVALALAGAVAVLAVMALRASVAGLAAGFDLSVPLARGTVLAAVAVIILPGGMAGLAGVAALAAVLGIAGWLSPLAALAASDLAPVDAIAATVLVELGGNGMSAVHLTGWALAAAGALVVLDTAQPAGTPRLARRAVVAAAVALPLLVTMLILGTTVIERRTDALFTTPVSRLPAAILSDRAHDQVVFCGRSHADARTLERSCERLRQDGRLPADAITIQARERGRWMATVLDLPAVAGVVRDLAIPAILIVFAALLLHAGAGLIVHDAVYRALGRQGTASGRLALHRVTTIALGWAALLPDRPWPGIDGALATTTALAALAALPVPLLLLGLWRRADWKAALCGLAAASGVMAAPWFGSLAPGFAVPAAPLACLGAGLLAALIFPAPMTPDTDAAAPAAEAGQTA